MVRHACELYLAPSPAHGPSTHSPRNRAIALLEARVAGGWDAAAARSVLIELEELVGADPPAEGAEQLRWRLERIRATSHELAELEVVEQLRGGGLQVPDSTDAGGAAAARRGRRRPAHPVGAARRRRARPDAAAAADQQRARWQQLAAHPATTRALRWLAEHAARTCTQLHAPATRTTQQPHAPPDHARMQRTAP